MGGRSTATLLTLLPLMSRPLMKWARGMLNRKGVNHQEEFQFTNTRRRKINTPSRNKKSPSRILQFIFLLCPNSSSTIKNLSSTFVARNYLFFRDIKTFSSWEGQGCFEIFRWQQCKRGGSTPATRFSLLAIELAIRWHGGRSLTENLKYSVF